MLRLAVLILIGLVCVFLYYIHVDATSIIWIMLVALYLSAILQAIYDSLYYKEMRIIRKVMSNINQKKEQDNSVTPGDDYLQTEDINPDQGQTKSEVTENEIAADTDADNDVTKSKETGNMTEFERSSKLITKKDEFSAQSNMSFALYLSKKKHDLSLFINSEDKDLWSEDAQPLNEHEADKNLYLLATFDGMGGAGAQSYELHDNTIRTGATIGAKLARNLTLEYFNNEIVNESQELRLPKDFHKRLETILKERFKKEIDKLHENPGNQPRIFGTLTRFLPTTAAMLFVGVNLDRSHFVSSVWAGDSINFLLTPEQGIQQITIDDFRVPCDALDRIRQGPILSNMVQACIKNRDYTLRRFDFEIPSNQKFILLSCSDGAFDYFSNPAEFELSLLKYMLAVDNPDAWKQNLTELFKKIAQDDVTMALRAFGFSSYDELKTTFEKRYAELNEMIAKVKREASEEIKNLTQETLSDDNRAKRDAEASENDVSEGHLANESITEPSDIENQSEEVVDEILKNIDHTVMPEEKRETVDDPSDKQMADKDNAKEAEQEAKPESDNSNRIEKPKSQSRQPLPDLDVNQRIWAEYKPDYEFYMQKIKRQLEN